MHNPLPHLTLFQPLIPCRQGGPPAGAWAHPPCRGPSPLRVGNPSPAKVNFAPRSARLAHRYSIAFTRQGSQVRTLYRPPSDARSHPCGGFFLCAELRNSDVFRHQRAPACHEARSSSALARLHARHGTFVPCPVQQASEGISMERELFSIEDRKGSGEGKEG